MVCEEIISECMVNKEEVSNEVSYDVIVLFFLGQQ